MIYDKLFRFGVVLLEEMELILVVDIFYCYVVLSFDEYDEINEMLNRGDKVMKLFIKIR